MLQSTYTNITIENTERIAIRQLVTLKAIVTKVIKEKSFKGQNEKGLKNTSTVLVDPTGSIHAIFWEDNGHVT